MTYIIKNCIKCINGSIGVLVMFSMSEVIVSEAGGVVDLTVIKTGANSKDVFVTFSTLDGNAVGNNQALCVPAQLLCWPHIHTKSVGGIYSPSLNTCLLCHPLANTQHAIFHHRSSSCMQCTIRSTV